MTDAPPPIGDNNPPPPTIAEMLAAAYADRLAIVDEIVAAGERLPAECAVGDDETLNKLIAYVKTARGHAGVLDDIRKSRKSVFDDLGKQVQGFFAPRLAKLDAVKAKAELIITRHNREKERIERERSLAAADEQRRIAEERMADAKQLEDRGRQVAADELADYAVQAEQTADALDRRAGASAADLARTRTEEGTASSKVVWSFQITDQAALRATLGKLGDHFSQAHIEQAIRGMMAQDKKVGRKPELPGVVFSQDTKAFIR